MTAKTLFSDLAARGVVLKSAADKLVFDAPTGVLTDDDRHELKRLKPELLLLLSTPTAPDVPPATEYNNRTFDDRLKLWRRGAFIEITAETIPAYRQAFAGKLTGGKL